MGGVQLLLQPSHFRLQLVDLRAEGVALARFPTATNSALGLEATPHDAPCGMGVIWEPY